MTSGSRGSVSSRLKRARSLWALVAACSAAALLWAAAPAERSWQSIGQEPVRLLQEYVRIDTSNPPDDVRPAAAFLEILSSRASLFLVRSIPTLLG